MTAETFKQALLDDPPKLGLDWLHHITACRPSEEKDSVDTLHYLPPRRPEQNEKVERSHRIDDEEFWQRHSFGSFDDASLALETWERRYSHERFSMALRGHTPSEALAAKLSAQVRDQLASIGAGA